MQRNCLLAPSAEDIWIASLEAHNTALSARVGNQQLANVLLIFLALARPMANVDTLAVGTCEVQKTSVEQVVKQNDIRFGNKVSAL